MTGTGGLAVTAGIGGGPDLAPGPGPGPGLVTGEIGATAETGGPPGGREATPEIVNLDLRAAADLADQFCVALSVL